MSIQIFRAADRFVTEVDGRRTAHSFSFGEHYDPRNLGFGPMIAHNDEFLSAGAGYEPHLHRDTEIVTWVVEGALRHTDDLGHSSLITPGQVQVLSAGSGVRHSETNPGSVPTRFVQTWLRPDGVGLDPRYAIESVPEVDGWTVLAGAGGLPINVAGASLSLGRSSDTLALPNAPLLHVFVIRGSVGIGEREIRLGSAARLIDEGGRVIHATDAEVLAWALPAARDVGHA